MFGDKGVQVGYEIASHTGHKQLHFSHILSVTLHVKGSLPCATEHLSARLQETCSYKNYTV
jgi:hypothetical protein